MREQLGNIWAEPADAVCVTTNGTVLADGRNIMGGGIARQALERCPGLDSYYGSLLDLLGLHVYVIGRVQKWPPEQGPLLVAYPTKATIDEQASLVLVAQSAKELVDLADACDWRRVLVPRPGAGLGGLDWPDVKKLIAPLLDDRFTVYGYAGEAS